MCDLQGFTPTPAPTHPPTRSNEQDCPLRGWDRFQIAQNHAVSATPDFTLTTSPENCMVVCLERRCKGFSLANGNVGTTPRTCHLYTSTTPAIVSFNDMNLTPEEGTSTFVFSKKCMPVCDATSSASEQWTALPGVRPKAASNFFKVRAEDSTATDTAELCGERCLETYKCKSFTWLHSSESSNFGRCQM